MRDYQNMVFTTAYRLLADESESEDIAQEVFLKAYDCFEELSHSSTPGGWLKTVTRNLCLNHLNRHRARYRLFSELENDSAPEGTDHAANLLASNSAGQDLANAEQREVLALALEKLPAAQRVPLVLHYLEDMSCEDISQALHVSPGKIKTDLHRGRLALRRILVSKSNISFNRA